MLCTGMYSTICGLLYRTVYLFTYYILDAWLVPFQSYNNGVIYINILSFTMMMCSLHYGHTNIFFLFVYDTNMSCLLHTSMPICAINPCNIFVILIDRLLSSMTVQVYEQHRQLKVIFMDC